MDSTIIVESILSKGAKQLVDCQFVFSSISDSEIVKAVIEVYVHKFLFKPRRDKFNFKVILAQSVSYIVRNAREIIK